MKRSDVNALIEDAKAFFHSHQFMLPPWAFWGPKDWKGKGEICSEIIHNMLGWDITEFGSGDFERCGLLLFTLRNGNPSRDRKTYAEKIMMVRENQETPMHFHWKKMEDIINRGGGNLVIELYQSTPEEAFSSESVSVQVDGITRQVDAGGRIVLKPGESICLTQGLYHRFYGEAGKGQVLVGEVSHVNDDVSDNRFYKQAGRFPALDEDVAPVHLLCSEYEHYV